MNVRRVTDARLRRLGLRTSQRDWGDRLIFPKSSNVGLPNELSIELPERLSIRLSKELSKGLSETAATIFKLIYADNYITRGDIAKKVGVSVTAVQKHVNKLKSIRLLDREGSASHGHWIIIEN